jgi:hypothetical protein
VEATWYSRSGWVWGNTFNYTYYKGLYNTSVPIWNTSFSKLLFKKKQGEIKLSVYDLLNQNKGISQQSNPTLGTIQQTTTTVLKRYIQLTFTYNIRNFGGKNMPSFFGGGRGGGGGRRGGGFGGGGFGGGRDF